MFSSNPFADLSAWISPLIMQSYLIVMIFLVATGTIYDVLHKGSAKYFWNNWRKAKSKGHAQVGGGRLISLATQTAIVDVMASGEFCNPRRRIAHLLTMYGFLAFAGTTLIMVFCYPTPDLATPVILPILWSTGALMICIGGYWFWFFIRVDVLAEGHSRFRLIRADLFVLSLLMSATMALAWAYLQASGSSWAKMLFVLFVIATTVLFGSVPWSKFAHMFFKPAAALEKRVSAANGSRSNLPEPSDKPANLGDSRRQPNHY